MSPNSNLNPQTISNAKQFIKQINFDFIFLLKFLCNILKSIDKTNTCVQQKKIAIDEASNMLKLIAACLYEMRKGGLKILRISIRNVVGTAKI